MAVGPDQAQTLAYVLRLWRVTDGREPIWRAALQDIRTGERRGFADLDEAWRYLRARIERGSGRLPGEAAVQDRSPPGAT